MVTIREEARCFFEKALKLKNINKLMEAFVLMKRIDGVLTEQTKRFFLVIKCLAITN
jgi:hypothetical protein